MPDNHLGAILLTARIGLGWSLRDAERETGVPNAHISQIEHGTIRKPQLETLGKLATGYGLSFAELATAAGYTSAEQYHAAVHEEQIRADERRKYEDLLGTLWLHIPWNYITTQITTSQKDLFADAVDAWSARLNEGDPDNSGPVAKRWWRSG